MLYDVVIIGAGPAGITASVYAARKRMRLAVITQDIGGQAAWSGDIENYTGYQFITGPDLAAKFQEHMSSYEIPVREGESVTDIRRQAENVLVTTDKAAYEAQCVIVASGKRTRKLNVPGEKEFKNKGLTYCATCDGPLFSGKTVAVIGGGNSALDAALQMMRIAGKIYLVSNAGTLTGDAIMREKIRSSPLIEFLLNTEVTAVKGDKFVTGLAVRSGGRQRELEVQGVFVEIGLIPNSDFARTLAQNESGEIVVNKHNETSVQGIFAAGDVTDVPEKQIIIAAGEGAKAALGAFRYISRKKAS